MAQHPGGRGTPFYYSTSSSTSPLSQSSNSPYPDADSSNPLFTPDPAMTTNYQQQPTDGNFFHQPSMSSNISYPEASSSLTSNPTITFPHLLTGGNFNQPSTSTFTQPQPGSSSLYQAEGHNFMNPYLIIINQPQNKFRFRFATEMGATHGFLMSDNTNSRGRRENIRVQLLGCQEGAAIIRCSLVTNSPTNPIPHVHQLWLAPDATGTGNLSNDEQYEDVPIYARDQWIATFSGLSIIQRTRNDVKRVIENRLLREKGHQLSSLQRQQLRKEAESIANSIDLHSVKLKFEAFIRALNGSLVPICQPVYSQPIFSAKNVRTCDLRIVRIDKVSGRCSGHEEVFIFVDKVNKKDIKVRFFETDARTNVRIWEAFADFSEADVHHQHAIAFRTPPYRVREIESEVGVQFELYRPSNDSVSEPQQFTYVPTRDWSTIPLPPIPTNSSITISHQPGPSNVAVDVMDVDHQMMQEDEELRRLIETLSELKDMEWVPDSNSTSKKQPLLLDWHQDDNNNLVNNLESKMDSAAIGDKALWSLETLFQQCGYFITWFKNT